MSAFVDTNVVVYAFDTADPGKQRAAIAVLGSGRRLVVSTQVVLELWWVLTRRLAVPLPEDQAAVVVDELCRLPVVTTDVEMVRRAIDTSRRFRIAVWDAMIVEAARSAGCDRVLTEDLQAGQDFDGITIENPFAR
jgi:predicted nucleic acid-binding protein